VKSNDDTDEFVDRGKAPQFPLFRIPSWLRATGMSAWLMLGILAFVVVAYLGLARISALIIPLVVAIVLGMIFHPLVDRLRRAGVASSLGAAIVMLGLVAVAASAVWLAVKGVIDQSGRIAEQVQLGWVQLQDLLTDFGVSLDGLKDLWVSVTEGSAASSGVSGLIQAGFSSAAAFAIGTFIGAFLLFYLLKDWHTLRGWVAKHLGLPEELGTGLIEDATKAIRGYFYGLTLASVPVALAIGTTMWILGLPLAAAVTLVTFLTSYIPYLGAIFSGAFAVLIALGAGGPTDAVIMLVVVLVTQNGLQTIVLTKFTSDQLSLHPIVNLGSTVVGATLAGLLGATLSAPIVAMLIAAHRRLRAHYGAEDSGAEDSDVEGADAPVSDERSSAGGSTHEA
jgi:predicted PurR-regulated permease PerM